MELPKNNSRYEKTHSDLSANNILRENHILLQKVLALIEPSKVFVLSQEIWKKNLQINKFCSKILKLKLIKESLFLLKVFLLKIYIVRKYQNNAGKLYQAIY